MKKIIVKASIVAMLGFIISGCSANNTGVAQENQENSVYNEYKIELTSDATKNNLHSSIIKACEESGWIATEFGNNSLIAEKIIADDSMYVTISFTKKDIIIVSDDSASKLEKSSYINELKEAINKEIQSEITH